MQHRCQMPGCECFVTQSDDRCERHAATGHTPESAIIPYLDALRSVLERLLAEIEDVESLSKHVPRVAGTAMQAIRLHEQLGSTGPAGYLEIIEGLVREAEASMPSGTER